MIHLKQMAIFAFSDTHGNHRELQVPESADIVICAGDAVEDNLQGGEYDDFVDWFSSLPAKYKIFIPGNHELSFELGQAESIIQQFTASNIIILQDSIIDCNGVLICSISGNAVIADEDIPTDIDVLVTHRPPFGILDEDMGSTEILNFVLRSKPQYHIFGHIHTTSGGKFMLGTTMCHNVSFCAE